MGELRKNLGRKWIVIRHYLISQLVMTSTFSFMQLNPY